MRWFLQIRLSWLMMGIVVLGIVMSIPLRTVHFRRRIFLEAEQVGFNIRINYELASLDDFLVNRLGRECFFSSSVSLSTSRDGVDDKNLTLLESVPRLSSLNIYDGNNVTDAGMAHISRLCSLKYLRIDWICPRHFPDGVPESRCSCPQITDQGIAHLSSLKQLKSIDLRYLLNVTDVRPLFDCKQLSSLDLPMTQVSDEGIQGISTLQELCSLTLCWTLITDDSLEEISRLPRLEHLDLSGTRVTDEGVLTLAKSRSLQDVDLTGTRVSEDITARFARLNPNVTLKVDRLTSETTDDEPLGFLIDELGQ